MPSNEPLFEHASTSGIDCRAFALTTASFIAVPQGHAQSDDHRSPSSSQRAAFTDQRHRLVPTKCGVSNPIACDCPTETPTCDLLPDLTIGAELLSENGGGILETPWDNKDLAKAGTLGFTTSIVSRGIGPLYIKKQKRKSANDVPTISAETHLLKVCSGDPIRLTRAPAFQYKWFRQTAEEASQDAQPQFVGSSPEFLAKSSGIYQAEPSHDCDVIKTKPLNIELSPSVKPAQFESIYQACTGQNFALNFDETRQVEYKSSTLSTNKFELANLTSNETLYVWNSRFNAQRIEFSRLRSIDFKYELSIELYSKSDLILPQQEIALKKRQIFLQNKF